MPDVQTYGFRVRMALIRFVDRTGFAREFLAGFLQYPFRGL